MNARNLVLACLIGLVGCGDDDAVADSGTHEAGIVDCGTEAGPDTGIDAGPDTGVEAGTGACDGPYQHPLYVMPFEGTCLGPQHAVPGSCVTGIEGMTGSGELWCFSSPEGVLHASLIQYGEDSPWLTYFHPGEFVRADQQACALALSQLDWIPDADAGFEAGTHDSPDLGNLPLCRSQ